MQQREQSIKTIFSGLQFWVNEATAARKAAAYVRGYVQVQSRYMEEKERLGDALSVPHYNPVARVAYGRLHVTWRELVLFSCRAMHDKSGYGLSRIKNDLCKLFGNDAVAEIESLKTTFNNFDSCNKERLDEIVVLRKKVVAHSDVEAIFGELDSNSKVSDVVELAEAVINLLEKVCAAYFARCSSSFEEKHSLIIHHEVHAAHDAQKFWEHNFELWAE